ncbi:MAG TPA: hypothetical protein VD837_08975 [Terriglobales bacterium]|nr:hypothetical protein [Terriglobales bacterium]
MQDLLQVLGLASVGITVATTGAALAVVYAVFSPCKRETERDFRRDAM